MSDQKTPVEETENTVEAEVAKAAEVMKNVVHSDDEAVVSAKALLEVGAYFGHQVRRWQPKMKPYIYGTRSGIHLIDLTKTVSCVQQAYHALKNIVAENGKVLFVGTKPQASDTIVEEAMRSGSFYINTKWLGGTMTNFKTISKRTKLLKTLQEADNEGEFDQLPKKEALLKRKLIAKLSSNLEGIKEMRRVPNAIVVVDPVNEHNAVAEAKILNIPVFALLDTNCDPNSVDYPIPCNDDSIKTIKLIIGILADAIVEAKGGEPLYAYKTDNELFNSMEDALRAVDRVEELRLIKLKFREDSYIIRGKGKSGRKSRVSRTKRPMTRKPADKPAEAAAPAVAVEAKGE